MSHRLSPQLVLTRVEAERIREAADPVMAYDLVSEADQYVAEAQAQSAAVPERVRRALLLFRRYGHPSGGFLIRGLPTGPVPGTAARADDGIGAQLPAAAVLSLLGAVIGDQFGFKPELAGHMVQDILPVRGFENTQQSTSSTSELWTHVETAFTEHRADYVGLFCLRPDHEGKAGTTLSPIEGIITLLDGGTIAVLRQKRFKTTVDGSFLRGVGRNEAILIGPIAVLEGSRDRPTVRADFAETTGMDPVAQAALDRVRVLASTIAAEVRLISGDLLMIDNRHSFHGRTPFSARWDGNDRWLLRTFLTRDLERSASVRPGDGRIIDADYARGPEVCPE